MNYIEFIKDKKEFKTEEQCHIVELNNSPADEDCSIARARVTPGVTTSLHSLKGIVERYVILSGVGEVKINGQAGQMVAAYDIVNIPQGVSQKITNKGTEDLIFLCICTPRFKQESYESITESV